MSRNASRLAPKRSRCAATSASKPIAGRCDVGVEANCKALAAAALARFGRIDVLVNNAGVSGHARFDEVTDFRWYEEGAMTTEECARQIIVALRARQRELVMTPKGRLGLWLKLIAPGMVDKMAQAAVKKEA